MEPLNFIKTPGSFHITDYPDAVKVIGLTGAEARQLSDYGAHLFDLDFATSCLAAINEEEDFMVREALWHSAVIHFIKCFQFSKTRLKLREEVVYESDSGARTAFTYVKNLRNKNIAHDENAYSQCLPGAVLNRPDANLRVPKVMFLTAVASTLGPEDWSNLHMLATSARDWIRGRVDDLSDVIARELNQLSYEELDSRPVLEYSKPGPEDLNATKTYP